jgi:hypothetical protein
MRRGSLTTLLFIGVGIVAIAIAVILVKLLG